MILLGLRRFLSFRLRSFVWCPMVLPGQFLDSPQLPAEEYLWRVQQVLRNYPVSPPRQKSSAEVPSSTVPSSPLSSAYVSKKTCPITFAVSAVQRRVQNTDSNPKVCYRPDWFKTRLCLCWSFETCPFRDFSNPSASILQRSSSGSETSTSETSSSKTSDSDISVNHHNSNRIGIKPSKHVGISI